MPVAQQYTMHDMRRLLESTARPSLLMRFFFWLVCFTSGREYRKIWREQQRAMPEIRRDCYRKLAIIDSMTPEERARPELISVGREYRIAQGSGTQSYEVRHLLDMYTANSQMLREWNKRHRSDRQSDSSS